MRPLRPSPARARRRGRLATKLAISLASLVAFLGGGELIARACGIEPYVSTTSPLWTGDEELHWRYMPHQELEVEKEDRTFRVRINNHGHRGADYPRAKPAGELRIVGVGDSMTYGPGVNDDETYLALLQKGLETVETPQGTPRVINTGVNGYSSFHYRRFCETQLDELQPDVVVMGLYAGNDNVITPTAKTVIPVPWQPLLRSSALAVAWDRFYRDWAWKRIQAAKQDKSFEEVEKELEQYQGIEPQNMDQAGLRETWLHAFEHVVASRDACEAAGAKLACLLLPDCTMTPQPQNERYAWLKGELEARGVTVIDSLEFLHGVHAEAWLPYDPGHFDRVGHREVARALFKGLKNSGMVRVE